MKINNFNLLYKKFFAEQFNVPVDNIDIEFFITRRKVYEGGDYPQKDSNYMNHHQEK